MLEFIKQLFTSDYMPHGTCYKWDPAVLWLHVISDSLIALAYYSIPLTLVYFVGKRRDVPYPWMFLLFGSFIVACGTTHLVEVWTVWHATYRMAGVVKLGTALLSIGTAILLVRITPQALKLQSPTVLAKLNAELGQQIGEREKAEAALRRSQEELEARVRERTEELARANAALQAEIAERKRAEEQVLELNSNLKNRLLEMETLLEVMPIGIGIAEDAQCRKIRQNRAFAKMLNLSHDANASKSAPPPELPTQFRICRGGKELKPEELPMQRSAANGETIREFEEEILMADGSVRHLLAYTAPLYDTENRVRGSVGAFVDITDRRRAEQRFQAAVEASPSAIVMVNQTGRIVLVNEQMEKIFGYRREELVGRPVDMLFPERFRTEHPGLRACFYGRPQSLPIGELRDISARHRNSTEMPVELGLNPIDTDEGVMVLSAIVDITERKEAERRIRASLHEKEALLQEIHHRVKNNMQVVSSLLQLQAGYAKDPDSREMLRESQDRIRSMALIHEKLYQSHDLTQVHFDDYLNSLVSMIGRSYVGRPGNVRVEVDAHQVAVDVNRAIPLGLIINELVTNALKHAFPDGREGEVRVELRRENGLTLTVRDNGKGVGPDFAPEKTDSLGLRLVRILAGQIEAAIQFSNANGFVVTLTVPEKV